MVVSAYRDGAETARAASWARVRANFHLLASGRLTVAEVRARVAVDGDRALAERALAGTWAPH